MTRATVVCASLLLVGCAAQPIYVPLSPCHPANPCALESPIAPPSGTLTISAREMMPRYADWQIPGIRDSEKNEHATGPFPMHGGHMMDHPDPSGAPGMVKMEAPEHVVDYAPANGAPHHAPATAGQNEQKPELHLEHTPRERREAPSSQAPIAPPKGKRMAPMPGMEGHAGHGAAAAPQEPAGTASPQGHAGHGTPSTPAAHEGHAAPTPASGHEGHGAAATLAPSPVPEPSPAPATPSQAPASAEHGGHH